MGSGIGRASGTAPLLETSAFSTFYEDALPKIYAYFFRRVGCRAAVSEDLTQETFLAAVQELKQGVEVEDPTAWILGVARHKLVDHYRREGREQKKRELVWMKPSPMPFAPGAGDLEDRVLEALVEVPAQQRSALTLRYLDGLSVPEVARVLGRSVHATESLLARGRESFRQRYAEAEHA